MEKQKVVKAPDKQVANSLGMIEIILFVVLCFALAFVLMGSALLLSTGLCFCWETVKVVIVIVFNGGVICFCVIALWWIFKHQRAKQEKSPAKSTSVAKRQASGQGRKMT